ncbi:hypothetical protein OEZ86_010190 [Tetradesmus obliquus]|nr:hypothetical protein OEZ86_010190 [Tetradesmus obliquus]
MKKAPSQKGRLTRKPSFGGHQGVSWDVNNASWVARIQYAGNPLHVGWYYDRMAAAKAYDKAAVFLYGASAITNFGIAACQEDPTQVSSLIVQAWEALKAAEYGAEAEAAPAHANPEDKKQELAAAAAAAAAHGWSSAGAAA